MNIKAEQVAELIRVVKKETKAKDRGRVHVVFGNGAMVALLPAMFIRWDISYTEPCEPFSMNYDVFCGVDAISGDVTFDLRTSGEVTIHWHGRHRKWNWTYNRFPNAPQLEAPPKKWYEAPLFYGAIASGAIFCKNKVSTVAIGRHGTVSMSSENHLFAMQHVINPVLAKALSLLSASTEQPFVMPLVKCLPKHGTCQVGKSKSCFVVKTNTFMVYLPPIKDVPPNSHCAVPVENETTVRCVLPYQTAKMVEAVIPRFPKNNSGDTIVRLTEQDGCLVVEGTGSESSETSRCFTGCPVSGGKNRLKMDVTIGGGKLKTILGLGVLSLSLTRLEDGSTVLCLNDDTVKVVVK